MPELPEVETVKNTLAAKITGQTITKAEILLPKYTATLQPERLAGLAIQSLSRRGKYLLLHLSEEQCLIFHLRMTGKLLYGVESAPGGDKYNRLVIYFNNGETLKFNDIRKFGMVWLMSEAAVSTFAGLTKLGCEPLSEAFTPQYLAARLAKRHNKIKVLLLDQTIIAGIGNIYADEALYCAGINPLTPGCALTVEQLERLCAAVREVISNGIKFGGTTIRDYVDGSGAKGNFQNYLAVYGKTGQACARCGTAIVRVKAGGRSTHYCPNCQPEIAAAEQDE